MEAKKDVPKKTGNIEGYFVVNIVHGKDLVVSGDDDKSSEDTFVHLEFPDKKTRISSNKTKQANLI